MNWKPLFASGLILTLSFDALAAVRGDRAEYVGGTVKEIEKGKQGTLDLQSRTELIFSYGKNQTFHLPYSQVKSLEFGQKVGRRVGATVALGVTTLGLMALPILFSKKKKHFLTISFADQAGEGVMVFELAKDTVRTTIPILETRSGMKVEIEGANPDEPKNPNPVSQKASLAAPVAVPAAPVAAPALRPSVQVASNPTDADVEINGVAAGKAPLSYDLPWGIGRPYTVKVRKAGYAERVYQLVVIDKPFLLDAVLAPAR